MSQTNLLDKILNRDLLTIVLEKAEKERKELEEYIISSANSSWEDGSPIPSEIIQNDLKKEIDKHLELTLSVKGYSSEIQRLDKSIKNIFQTNTRLRTVKIAKYDQAKQLVNEWQKNNPGSTKNDAFFSIGETLKVPMENVKNSYYYSPKKSKKNS